MKALLLVIEDAAGLPQDALDGRTPLQVARCPAATRLAGEGMCGVLARPPSGETARAEAYLAGLLGVPRGDAWRLARGPLEAEACGADWIQYDYAYRADLVTLDEDRMQDGLPAGLTGLETERLADALRDGLLELGAQVAPAGDGHLALLMKRDESRLDVGWAPWLLEGEDEVPEPERRRGEAVRAVFERAAALLPGQPINEVRLDLRENPANALWLWGGGPRVELPDRLGGRALRGVLYSRSAMARGLGRRLGLTTRDLAPSWLEGEGQLALTAEEILADFEQVDLVCVYVEAPRAFLRGPAEEHVRLMERIDVLLTAPLLEAMKRIKLKRMVLAAMPSAGVPGRIRGPRWPVTVWGAHVHPDEAPRWDEVAGAAGDLGEADPVDVFGRLMGG